MKSNSSLSDNKITKQIQTEIESSLNAENNHGELFGNGSNFSLNLTINITNTDILRARNVNNNNNPTTVNMCQEFNHGNCNNNNCTKGIQGCLYCGRTGHSVIKCFDLENKFINDFKNSRDGLRWAKNKTRKHYFDRYKSYNRSDIVPSTHDMWNSATL